MAGVATRLAVDAGDPEALLAAAEREAIDLTVVGPELPLDRGIVDLFTSRGRLIFGPRAPRRSSSAARSSRRTSWRATGSRRRAIASASTSTRRARCCVRASSGLPVVRQGRRPRRRQGRRRRRRSRGRRSGDPRGHGRSAVRRRRRATRARGMPRGPEVSFFALCDGTRARAAALGAGSQAHLRRRPRAEHRRHGRVLAEPAGRRGDAGGRSCATSSSRCSAACAAEGTEYRGLSLRRPDADLRRPEGDRVQRPLRRSRGAGGHAGRSTATGAAARRGGGRRRSTAGRSTFSRDVAGRRRARVRRAIPVR